MYTRLGDRQTDLWTDTVASTQEEQQHDTTYSGQGELTRGGVVDDGGSGEGASIRLPPHDVVGVHLPALLC